jgi:arylsulfatase A-like enzyme
MIMPISNDSIEQKPNLVFVITDDQGYGDFSCHGNPIIETPNLDAMHSESLRLTNLHVGPTCAPTRAGIMTGRYCNCTGVWHTIGGRSLLRNDERTMADIFQANGYKTGMFGKWHLGDNYPYRPHDRGFEEALYHGGGGISQTPDHWGNDYFDDTYARNGLKEPFEGYCTDVWFGQAMQFIERNQERPFFCYLPTNAPHSPYHVPNGYSEPYYGRIPDARANFYGMIVNIDENLARLRNHLRELEIEDNTILIFMTDNGSAEGCTLDGDQFVREGFNAGRRGRKGSEYEGGHRVPLFMYWPNGGFTEGRDIDQLTASIDLLPTLIDLCQLEVSETDFGAGSFHGMSLAPLLKGETETLPERVIVTDSQRVEHPIKWKQSATMTQRWRLINGVELYDIEVDPEQRNDIAAAHPEVVEELRGHYEAWWELVSPRFGEDPPIVLGTENEKVSVITTHDWHGEQHAWNQGHIRQGLVCNGYWAIEIAEDGEYAFELRRWPKEEDKPLAAGIPGEIIDWYNGGKALNLKTARLCVGDQEATQSIDADAKGVTFTFRLAAGEMQLRTFLTDDAGESIGAYYVYVTKVA